MVRLCYARMGVHRQACHAAVVHTCMPCMYVCSDTCICTGLHASAYMCVRSSMYVCMYMSTVPYQPIYIACATYTHTSAYTCYVTYIESR